MIENQTGVYQIINNINNKSYIGSAAVSFKKRWRRHINDLDKKIHCNIPLQRAWNKYKKENFSFEIIKICNADDCIKYEQEYIDKLKPEYNLCKIAGSSLGFKASQKTKIKMSMARKGKKIKSEIIEARIRNKTHAGENNGRSKLTQLKANQIRELYKTGNFMYKDLAIMFNVCTGAIGDIIRNKTWKSKIDVNEKDRLENIFKTGAFNGRAKLTEEDVYNIRYLWNSRHKNQKELASIYKISLCNINLIINNKIWIDKNYLKWRDKI